MSRFDVWNPRPANTPSDLDQLRARLRALGVEGVTLQWTAPKEGGVTELWRTDALARAVHALHGDGLRVGVMEWAGADSRLVRAHLQRLGDLLTRLDQMGGAGALAFVELDAEEEWVDDGAAEVTQAVEALEAGWADLGEICPEIVVTTIPSLPIQTHGLLQLPRVRRWRPQWYNFRKPQDPTHWSHKMAPPRQQMAAWQKIARDVLSKGWVEEVEAGLACYWQGGMTDGGRGLTPREALDLSLELAEGFSGGSEWLCYWSLPWITGDTERWWASRAADGEAEPDPPQDPPLPPAIDGGGSNEIRRLQRQLARWGYGVGAADGKMGPRTRAAAEAYRRDAAAVEGILEGL